MDSGAHTNIITCSGAWVHCSDILCLTSGFLTVPFLFVLLWTTWWWRCPLCPWKHWSFLVLSLQREQPLFLHPGPLFVSILSHIRGFSFTVREQADPVSSQPGLQNPIAAFLSSASPGDGGLQLLSVGGDHLEDFTSPAWTFLCLKDFLSSPGVLSYIKHLHNSKNVQMNVQNLPSHHG